MTPFSAPLPVLAPVVLGSIVAGFAAAMTARKLASTNQPSFIAMMAGSAVLGLWAALILPTSGALLAITCGLGWALLVLSAVDAAVFRLPDILTLPLLALGLCVSWFLPDRDLAGHAIGALCGLLSFYAIAQIYRRTRGREGLGLGRRKARWCCRRVAGVAGAAICRAAGLLRGTGLGGPGHGETRQGCSWRTHPFRRRALFCDLDCLALRTA